jgi:DNA ligase D-like protein (predicted polymerase)
VNGRVRVSHPDKVLFPDDAITKADLVGYYQTVAPRMLPLVDGRPVTMQRFPNGIGEGGFLQKQIGKGFPDWIDRVTAPNRRTRQGTTREEVTYVVCRTADDLVYLANQGCITPHVWLSRAPDLHHPDQMVFDLDPASTDLGVLRAAAAALHDLLDELGLPAFLKSSGSRGLHVVVPLVPAADTDTVNVFGLAVADALAATPTTSPPRAGSPSGRAACTSTPAATATPRPWPPPTPSGPGPGPPSRSRSTGRSWPTSTPAATPWPRLPSAWTAPTPGAASTGRRPGSRGPGPAWPSWPARPDRQSQDPGGRSGRRRSATSPKWSLAQTPSTGWSKASEQPATSRVGPWTPQRTIT